MGCLWSWPCQGDRRGSVQTTPPVTMAYWPPWWALAFPGGQIHSTLKSTCFRGGRDSANSQQLFHFCLIQKCISKSQNFASRFRVKQESKVEHCLIPRIKKKDPNHLTTHQPKTIHKFSKESPGRVSCVCRAGPLGSRDLFSLIQSSRLDSAVREAGYVPSWQQGGLGINVNHFMRVCTQHTGAYMHTHRERMSRGPFKSHVCA